MTNTFTPALPTDADRADYRSLMDTAKVYRAGDAERISLQWFAANAIVSCYMGSDGEPQHEQRRDGSCRCGKYAARFVNGQEVILKGEWSTVADELAMVDENHGDRTITVRILNSEVYLTVPESRLTK